MLLLFELKPLSNSIFLFPSPFGEDAQRAGEVEKVPEGRMRSRGVAARCLTLH